MFCDTGKICFNTPKEASTAAANLSKHDKRRKYSFYQCPLCKFYHTNTVKSAKKKSAQRKEKYPFRYVPPPKEEPVKKKKRKFKKPGT